VVKRDPEPLDKVDVPQGTLELMILTILAREPLHGYGLSQRLTALSHDHFRVNPGSLFPSLYRLEQARLMLEHSFRTAVTGLGGGLLLLRARCPRSDLAVRLAGVLRPGLRATPPAYGARPRARRAMNADSRHRASPGRP
jgi:hypothetical protein